MIADAEALFHGRLKINLPSTDYTVFLKIQTFKNDLFQPGAFIGGQFWRAPSRLAADEPAGALLR